MATTEKYYNGNGNNAFDIPASIPFLETTDIKVQIGSLKLATGTGNAGQTVTHGIATAEFPNDTDLKVRISNVLKTLNTDYTLSANKEVITFTDAVPNVSNNIRICTNGTTQNQGTDYTIDSQNKVQFTDAVAVDKSVRIYRETAIENLKGGEFAAGTAITAAQLNDNAKQLLYAAQEFPANFGDARNYGWNIPAATKNDIQVVSDTDWKIVDNAIQASMLQTDSVEEAKIKNDAVTTNKIKDNAVTVAKIPDDSITHDKLKDNIYRAYTSIRDYGAKGDGSTDDTTAIKNAIAAQDGGDSIDNNVIYFPAGTYIVTQPIIIPARSYIQGAGMDRTTIKMKNTIGRQTALCVVGNPDTLTQHVTINDITFDSNSQRWHGYNVSSGTATTGTEYANYTGVYSDSPVTSGATWTQTGKIVTISKTNHGLEHGAHITVTGDDDPSGKTSIVNADHTDTPYWEVIEVVNANQFRILVTPSQDVNSDPDDDITYKECVEGAEGKGLFIHNSKNVRLNRVKVQDSPNHNFDISSTSTHGAPINTADAEEFEKTEEGYYLKAALYHGRYCENIWLNQCHSKGAGDDNFTTHFSTNIFFNDCYSEFPRGGKSTSTNSNCYEVDDGSSNVTISNCQARGGNDALEIKAHGYAPAPFNIFVNGFTSINSTKGISLHHSNWFINTSDEESAWAAFDGEYDEDFKEINSDGSISSDVPSELRYSASPKLSDNGYSLHARNVQLDNIRVIALCDNTLHKRDGSGNDASDTVQPEHAIQISGYRGVSVSNLYISEGLDDRTYNTTEVEITDAELPFEYKDANSAEKDSDALVHIRRSCRDLTFTNTVINGYWDKFARAVWIRRRTQTLGADDGEGGTYSEHAQEQNNGGIIFNGFTCIDGPLVAFEGDGSDETYWGTLTGYNIHQHQQVPTTANQDPSDPPGDHWRDGNKKAIDINNDGFQLGSGTIIGYPDDKSLDFKEWSMHLFRSGSGTDTIACTDVYSYFERIGNIVICQGKIKDINITGKPTSDTIRMTLPYEPIEEGMVGSCATWDINFSAVHEGDDDEIQNIVCMAKTGVGLTYNGTAVNGYLVFRAAGADPDDDSDVNVDATLLHVGDLNDDDASINFAITYFCKPNATINV